MVDAGNFLVSKNLDGARTDSHNSIVRHEVLAQLRRLASVHAHDSHVRDEVLQIVDEWSSQRDNESWGVYVDSNISLSAAKPKNAPLSNALNSERSKCNRTLS